MIDAKENSLHHFNGCWADRFETPYFLTICMRWGIPIVRLRRRNVFLQELSHEIAVRSTRWHVLPDEHPIQEKLVIDVRSFEQRMDRWVREAEFVDRCVQSYDRVVTFWYEDIFEEYRIRAGVISQLSVLLGQEIDVDPWLVFKKSVERPADFIENADEVRNHFRNSKYDQMLQEAFSLAKEA